MKASDAMIIANEARAKKLALVEDSLEYIRVCDKIRVAATNGDYHICVIGVSLATLSLLSFNKFRTDNGTNHEEMVVSWRMDGLNPMSVGIYVTSPVRLDALSDSDSLGQEIVYTKKPAKK